MRSVLAVALAALFALPVTAMAEEVRGKIKTVDHADHAFVLEDGTRLWIDEGRLAHLREGEKVLVTYSTRDGKNIVSEVEFRTAGDAGETTNLGTGIAAPFDEKSVQASE